MFRPQEKPPQRDDFIDLEAAMPLIKKPAPINYWLEFDVPDEILLAVMQHLSPNDIQQLAKTSRRFHDISIGCLRGTERKFREWRIGLFRKQQTALNDDIDFKSDQKHSGLGVLLTIVAGSLMTGLASYANYKETTTSRNPSRDEKIFVALFLVISVIVLLVGIGRAIYNGYLSYSIDRDSRHIDHLQTKISGETAEIRRAQIAEETAVRRQHRT